MWMKNKLWKRWLKVYEVIEKVPKIPTFSLSTMVSKKQDNYATGATGPKLMISWPNKKSLKWASTYQ